MLFKNIIKIIFKNIFSIIIGAIFGLLVLWTFLIGPLLNSALSGQNFAGVLAGALVLPIFYSIFALIVGGLLGLIVYNFMKFVKKKKSKKSDDF